MTVIPVAYRFVERARQRFVRAEENYLLSHGWERRKIGEHWYWQHAYAPPGSMILTRSDAVQFQLNT